MSKKPQKVIAEKEPEFEEVQIIYQARKGFTGQFVGQKVCFVANDAIGSGVLTLSITKGNFPAPVSVYFEPNRKGRSVRRSSFAMSVSEAKRFAAWIVLNT